MLAGALAHSQTRMNNTNLIENLMAKRSSHSVDEIEMTKLHRMHRAQREYPTLCDCMHVGFEVERTPKYILDGFFLARFLARLLVCVHTRADFNLPHAENGLMLL